MVKFYLFTLSHYFFLFDLSAFRPIVHEFKVWPDISYETSLNQSPFDVPKVKTKSRPKLETPCEQPSSNNDEETVSLAIKRLKMVSNFFLLTLLLSNLFVFISKFNKLNFNVFGKFLFEARRYLKRWKKKLKQKRD